MDGSTAISIGLNPRLDGQFTGLHGSASYKRLFTKGKKTQK